MRNIIIKYTINIMSKCYCAYDEKSHETGECGCHTLNDYEECEYYKTYTGPKMTSIEVDEISDGDLFSKLKELYGDSCNWDGKKYRAGSILSIEYLGKTIKFNYVSENGRTHWTKYVYTNDNEIINPPSFAPFDEKYNRIKVVNEY